MFDDHREPPHTSTEEEDDDTLNTMSGAGFTGPSRSSHEHPDRGSSNQQRDLVLTTTEIQSLRLNTIDSVLEVLNSSDEDLDDVPPTAQL